MGILVVAMLLAGALLVRRYLPQVASARLGRAAFWLCNAVAALVVVVLGAVALRGSGSIGIELVFLPLYVGLGAAVVLFGLLLQRILHGNLTQ